MFFVIQKRKLQAVALLLAAVGLMAVLPRQNAAVPISAAIEEYPPVVVIDPGHGGEDGGTVASDGTTEAEINLSIALQLREILFLSGVETKMTRETDCSIHTEGETIRARKASDIRNRVNLVNATDGAILISIHQNSLPQAKSVHGAQVFYSAVSGSEELAKEMQARLNTSINTDRAKEMRAIDSSVYLMKHVASPAVLVECGFLSNEGETALLKTKDHQNTIALTVAAGYLTWQAGGEQELS